MKTLFKTVWPHLFVGSTSIAALLHSMWVIAHVLGGKEPVDAPFGLLLGYWLPGLFVAISLDIGLLSTSVEIRNGNRNRTRFLTLGVFSLSMFYLQMVYAVIHYAPLPLGDGVRTDWTPLFAFFRDSGVVVVPLLMPISILLFSFGHETAQSVTQAEGQVISDKNKEVDLPEPTPEPTAALVPVARPVIDEDLAELDRAIYGEEYTADVRPLERSNGHHADVSIVDEN